MASEGYFGHVGIRLGFEWSPINKEEMREERRLEDRIFGPFGHGGPFGGNRLWGHSLLSLLGPGESEGFRRAWIGDAG